MWRPNATVVARRVVGAWLAVPLALMFYLSLTSAQGPVIPSGVCGNGVAEPGEQCDPGQPEYGVEPDLGGATCEGQGFTGGGEIVCATDCTLDLGACFCEQPARLPATGQTRCWRGVWPYDEIACHGSGCDGATCAGAALSYTDHGDGTITDENTGLMWERKDDSGGIHDKDARYTWVNAFPDFIDKLNDTCEGDGIVWCDGDEFCGAGGRCGLAGYRDWRMPNVKELQTIVNYGSTSPSVHPVFHAGCVGGCTQCSCTVQYFYWSSSSYVLNAYYAWDVNFRNGLVSGDGKDRLGYVRAVRGGL